MARKSITKGEATELNRTESITKEEATELNKAIITLRNFCKTRSHCNSCPFKKEDFVTYGEFCKFRSFYPGLWDGLEIKEEEQDDHD